MRLTTSKKLLAVTLVVAMTLCLLAGCGSNSTPQETDPVTNKPVPVGMLVLTAGASVSIGYDTDGLVLNIEGNNDSGMDLADKYSDYLGKTCAAAAKELIAAAVEAGHLTADVKNIVIKQSLRSELPGSHFLETVETEVKAAAEAAGSSAAVLLIDESKLDDKGYINLETAKALLCNEMGVEKLDKYYGSESPSDGSYICTVEIAGKQTSHNIDAVTGIVADATEEELLGDPEDDEAPIDETTEENYVEDTLDEVVAGTITEETSTGETTAETTA